MAPSRWQRLLAYYRSCVAVENTAEVVFDAANNGRGFIGVGEADEPLSAGLGAVEFSDDDEKFRSFSQDARWDKSPPTHFYGFPCRIAGRRIWPLFIFDTEETQSAEGRVFVIQPGQPRLNGEGWGFQGREQARTAAQLLSQAWDDDKPPHANIDVALEALKDYLPASAPPVGVFFRAVDSTFTRGLESELRQLEERGPSSNGVWRLLLDRNGATVDEEAIDVMEVTPLNDEQRIAVKSAFVNPLTVVTGPPGTGKSQVILNVVATALARGETVLFGSKNRQAVSVVVERMTSIQSQPLIFEYANQEQAFANALLQALDRASARNPRALESDLSEQGADLSRCRETRTAAERAIDRIVNRRNRIQDIEIDLERLAEEMPRRIAAGLAPFDELQAPRSFSRELAAVERLLEEAERPSFMGQLRSLIGQSPDKLLEEAARALVAAMPESCSGLPSASRTDCRELVTVGRTLQRWIDLHTELLSLARDNWDEPRLELLRARIANSREQETAVNVRRVGSLAVRRMMQLTPAERRAASDYAMFLRDRPSYTGSDYDQELYRAREKAFRNGAAKAFPAIAVTNLVIRRVAPLAADTADLVVIDEASQCDIPSALPLLYRGRRALVIGDPNQLQHISQLKPDDDVRLRKGVGLNQEDDHRFAYASRSVFDLARSVVGSGARFVQLREHFRSREEIIGFSNQQFYGGDMTVETDYRQRPLVTSDRPVTWRDVKGVTERPPNGGAYNDAEVEAVVELVEKIVNKTAARPELSCTLGVVTPFREQANRIRRLAEQQIDVADLQRIGFAADTAFRYQGDERDIIIFSPVIARNARDSAKWFVGGDSNLFNVAVTRARSEMHIVGDMTACANAGSSFLSAFVKYVEGLRPAPVESGPFQSIWEDKFHAALRGAGINTISQYRFDQYALDLAIPDACLDIEIDGEYYHRNLDGSRVLSDLKRDTRLTSRGWTVKRFWVYELQHDMARCVREIQETLANQQGGDKPCHP